MASRACSFALAKRARRALQARRRASSVRIVIIVTPTERPAMNTAPTFTALAATRTNVTTSSTRTYVTIQWGRPWHDDFISTSFPGCLNRADAIARAVAQMNALDDDARCA